MPGFSPNLIYWPIFSTCALWRGCCFLLPVLRQQGSSLKEFTPLQRLSDIGKTELLYMQTARDCGITIPRIGLVRDRYFAIERFDYAPDGQRLHVLTASALLKTDFLNPWS